MRGMLVSPHGSWADVPVGFRNMLETAVFEHGTQVFIGIPGQVLVFKNRAVLFSNLPAECVQVAICFDPVPLSELGGALQKAVFPVCKLAVDGVPRVANDGKETDIVSFFMYSNSALRPAGEFK